MENSQVLGNGIIIFGCKSSEGAFMECHSLTDEQVANLPFQCQTYVAKEDFTYQSYTEGVGINIGGEYRGSRGSFYVISVKRGSIVDQEAQEAMPHMVELKPAMVTSKTMYCRTFYPINLI